MTRVKPLILAVTFWLLGCCYSLHGAENASSPAVQITSIQADFQQEKHMKMLVRPIISHGTFSFQTPASLRWEYTSPVPSILLMHGDSARKFMAVDGKLEEAQGLPMGSMQLIMAEIINWLDGRFTENKMFTVSYPDTDHIVLTPKKGMLEGIIDEIELELTDQNGVLEAVTIREGNEGYTRMTFTNRRLNRELPITLFTAQ